jgi:hypothetical protein
MAQAKDESTKKLSNLIRDPIVRSTFKRAERDYGQTFAIPNDLPNDVDFEDVIASDKPSSRKCHRGAAS